MPIYEFRCESCGARFEALVAAGDEPACPTCGEGAVRRVYSPQAPPFRLVKTPAGARKRERRNAELRERTKAKFKQARAGARQRARPGGDGDR